MHRRSTDDGAEVHRHTWSATPCLGLEGAKLGCRRPRISLKLYYEVHFLVHPPVVQLFSGAYRRRGTVMYGALCCIKSPESGSHS